ncbi:hypothetical protein F4778DRAFT_777665 [Xylariomycetidae sp. FL2044]|nr:hypothetical protein F4778DRAFT_777665 [Xylariomycetidae sp. FL2044]
MGMGSGRIGWSTSTFSLRWPGINESTELNMKHPAIPVSPAQNVDYTFECDIALICASAPTLRPLIARIWSRLIHEPPAPRAEATTSINLTTVVSYYGYPWTEPSTRCRNGSLACAYRCPVHRSPRILTQPSAPASRLSESQAQDDDDEAAAVEWRRRRSVGFEGYEEQYFGYGEEEREKISGFKGPPLKTAVGLTREWSDSQESFMALSDPASPRTLSFHPSVCDDGRTEKSI